MLTLDEIKQITQANRVYTGNRSSVALFQLKDIDPKHTTPVFVKINKNLFTLRNLPSPNEFNNEDVRVVAESFVMGYGWDVDEPNFFRTLPEIVENNDTLRKWATHRYYTDNTRQSKGVYVVTFMNPKTPTEVKAFIVKAFIAIQTQLAGEMNKHNSKLVKKMLQKEI